MTFRVRAPEDSDWPAILAAANVAAPGEDRDNGDWVQNRCAFAAGQQPHRHYVVEDTSTGGVVGYGAIEGAASGSYRIFVVVGDALLESAGNLLYDRLARDLTELGATAVWAREHATAAALLGFFRERGLAETERRYVVAARQIVAMERRL